MDIVLEVADTFLLDRLYAKLVPAGPAPYDLSKDDIATNASTTASLWQYKPATSVFTLLPSPEAYMSAWPRDNLLRQFISLFFITW